MFTANDGDVEMHFFRKYRHAQSLIQLKHQFWRDTDVRLYCHNTRRFTDKELLSLGKSIESSSMKKLSIVANQQGAFGEFDFLFPFLSKTKKLEMLSIERLSITSDIAKLLDFLENSLSLNRLELRRSVMATKAMLDLMNFVKRKNPRLDILVFDHSTLGFDHMNIIASEIAQGLPLKSLSLVSCGVDDTRVAALAAAVKKKDSKLQDLKLSDNPITQTGAETLAAAIAQGTSLRHLEVSYNSIPLVGARALIAAFYQNPSLLSLDYSPRGRDIEVPELWELHTIALGITNLREAIRNKVESQLALFAAQKTQSTDGLVRKFLEADGDHAILSRTLQFDPELIDLLRRYHELPTRYPWLLETLWSSQPKRSGPAT